MERGYPLPQLTIGSLGIVVSSRSGRVRGGAPVEIDFGKI